MTDFEAWYLERYPDLDPNLDDAFDELRSAFNAGAASQAMTWQPIETAPKDGTVIDLWAVCGHDYSGRAENQYWNKKRRVWVHTHGGDLSPFYVTHWMPIPDAPTGETP
jgi:hypothetical protein